MFEFQILGDAWLDSSWKGPDKVFTYLGIYYNVLSIQFNKYPECFISNKEGIQDDLFDFLTNNENDYLLNVKKQLNNEILLVVSFNFSEEMSVASMDVSLNGKKIAKLESGSPKAIINWPYRLVYINKKLNRFFRQMH